MYWDLKHTDSDELQTQVVNSSLETGRLHAVATDDFPAGLLFGMHVYTTFRFPLAPVWQQAHWQRLTENAQAIGLDWPFQWADVSAVLEQCYRPETPVFRLTAMADVRVYGDFDRNPKTLIPARLVLSARSVPPMSSTPLRLQTACYMRPSPLIKWGAMAESILLKRAARGAGFDDVLFLSEAGMLREASTSNVFVMRRQTESSEGDSSFQLETPNPQRDGCLPGIARLQVIEAATALNLPVCDEQPISVQSLKDADGVFLSNAAQGLRTVQSLDYEGEMYAFPWTSHALFVKIQASNNFR
jgi:branched-subunit amino acid aminotransferase/4-amino-4-deoxychorismate lyase